ncbi:MAG: hypothetical protein R3F43_12115 [bacterium]
MKRFALIFVILIAGLGRAVPQAAGRARPHGGAGGRRRTVEATRVDVAPASAPGSSRSTPGKARR